MERVYGLKTNESTHFQEERYVDVGVVDLVKLCRNALDYASNHHSKPGDLIELLDNNSGIFNHGTRYFKEFLERDLFKLELFNRDRHVELTVNFASQEAMLLKSNFGLIKKSAK